MDAPLRYLTADDVEAAMPTLDERLALARRTMVALAGAAQLPPKIGVHPTPSDSFGHAMPAWAPGDDGPDLLGMKWVVGFPANVDRGLPAIHGTVLLSDASTGRPRAFLDAGPITAQRTAAISGTAIERFGPRGDGMRVAMLGAGVQARSHLPVIAHLLPDADIIICDRDPERLEEIADDARSDASGLGTFGSVDTTPELATAVDGADLVVSIVSFGPDRQAVPLDAFGAEATVIAVDYDMTVPAAFAERAALFLTDDIGQFLANRTGIQFAGYPDPGGTIGAAILADETRPAGPVLVSHLGVGLADVVFSDAILRAAEREGIGTILD